MKTVFIYFKVIYNVNKAYQNDDLIKKYDMKIYNNNIDLPYISYFYICKDYYDFCNLPTKLIHEVYINMMLEINTDIIKEDVLIFEKLLIACEDKEGVVNFSHICAKSYNYIKLSDNYILKIRLYNPENPLKEKYKNIKICKKICKKLFEDIKSHGWFIGRFCPSSTL